MRRKECRRMGSFRVARLNKHQEDALQLVVESKSDVFVNLPTGSGKSVIFQALSGDLALSIVYSYVKTTNQSQKNRMLSQAIACVHVQPPFFYPGNHRGPFFLRTTRLRIVGLIDEISTKRTHIKEKIRGNFFIYLPTESLSYHTLLF